jgi:hypothetical protein
MLPIAVISVAAVATAGIALSIATARDGSVQLQPEGIIVTPRPSTGSGSVAGIVPSATDGATPGSTGSGGAPTTGAGTSGASAPSSGPSSGAGSASGGVQTVDPAPARTLPARAATGRPETPGQGGSHKPAP